MNRYLFILGRKSELAFYELDVVLHRKFSNKDLSIEKDNNYAIVQTKYKLRVNQLIKILGGTVKICHIGKTTKAKTLLKDLTSILRNESFGKTKLNFGISCINKPESIDYFLIPKQLKSSLNKENISSRYILPGKNFQLSSAQVKLGDITEFYLIWSKNNIYIAKTIVVQDFRGFSRRDYQRPYVLPREGMLPPKVARMMVNLAFPEDPRENDWLLDPFCGTGTIAQEALSLNINCLNSDISEKKVKGTRENLKWLSKQENIIAKWKVLKGNATNISEINLDKIKCIVTEPFLGQPNVNNRNIKNIIKGLNKLYLGALKDWRNILVKNGRIVMAFPEIQVEAKTLKATLVIDMRENVGYTLVAGPFSYERKGAKVKRLIYILEKK